MRAPLCSGASTTTTVAGQAGDDAVPGREAPCQRRLAQVVLGDQRAVAPDGMEEAPVAPGVDDVDATSEYANRRAPGLDRPLVRRRVHP